MIIMENIIQFIDKDLGASKVLNNIKSTDKIILNKFLTTFKEFHDLNFNSYITQEHLNKFEWAKYIVKNPPAIIDFMFELGNKDDKLYQHVSDILKLYYLYIFGKHETNSFNQYLFTKNVADAVDIISEFHPAHNNREELLIKFVKNQHQIVKNTIEFEKQNRKLIPLLGFISSLPAGFKNQFNEDKFIPFLIVFLYENNYIDSYGTWIYKIKKQSELIGLINALKILDYIRSSDTYVKISFRNTFRSNLTRQYLGREEYSQVKKDAQDFFVVALRELHSNKMPSNAVI